MFQSIPYRFRFLCHWLFQFLYRIRSIIHRQSQLSLYLCDICGMYFEAILRFYVLFNHLVCNSLFRLVRLGSLGDIIKRHFALILAKLHFYVDYTVRFFVGKYYYHLHMFIVVQTSSHIFLFLICLLFQHFYRVQIVLFYITNGSGFIFLIFICCLINSLLMRDTSISLQ